MQASPGAWVTVRYRLFDSEGEPLEDVPRELTYLHGGYGSVFEAIERALDGAEVGFQTSVYLQPEESFGDYDADRLTLAPREQFPEALERGMSFEGIPGQADSDGAIYTVTDFTDETVVLDGNHPLAGMALRFELEVTDLREATEEEVEQEAARPRP